MNPQRPAALPLTAIQVIEQAIQTYQSQRDQALAQLHATEGALMSSQQLLKRLQDTAFEAQAQQLLDAKTKTQDSIQALNDGLDKFEEKLGDA